METVDLGEFENTQLIPHLSFTYTPATSADVTPQVVRSTVEDGGVRVVVHLQNFGSQPVTVAISEDRSAASAGFQVPASERVGDPHSPTSDAPPQLM